MIVPDSRTSQGLVWLASYPKSGNTWVRAFVHALRRTMSGPAPDAIDINAIDDHSVNERAARLYERHLGRHPLGTDSRRIAALRPLIQQEICRSAGGLVLVKTHNAMGDDHGYPLINRAVSAGAIYVVRNPLDVAISFAHYRSVSIDQIITDMATLGFGAQTDENQIYYASGTWSQNVESWTARPNDRVLVVRYESMLDRPTETFAAVARHLLMAPTAAQLQQAIDLTAFDRLRAAEAATGFVENPEHSMKFFRAGRAGQWRDILTTAQASRIVADHRAQMARFDYLPR